MLATARQPKSPFCDLTDTEANQVQTLCRVQPLHRQVRPPLSLGGELCRYDNSVCHIILLHVKNWSHFLLARCSSPILLSKHSPRLNTVLMFNTD